MQVMCKFMCCAFYVQLDPHQLAYNQESARSFYVAVQIESVLSSSGGQLHIKGFMIWLLHAMSTTKRTSTPGFTKVVQVLLQYMRKEGKGWVKSCSVFVLEMLFWSTISYF